MENRMIAPPPDAGSPEPDWHDYVRINFSEHAERLAEFEKKLDANSAATARVESSTRDIVEMMESWKGAMKTIGAVGTALRPLTWILAFCTALLGLWAAVKQVWGGGGGK